jgi:hypothetical protein
MSISHSALAHEIALKAAASVAAIVDANKTYPDAIFRTLVSRCRILGLSLAGVLQHPDRAR